MLVTYLPNFKGRGEFLHMLREIAQLAQLTLGNITFDLGPNQSLFLIFNKAIHIQTL